MYNVFQQLEEVIKAELSRKSSFFNYLHGKNFTVIFYALMTQGKATGRKICKFACFRHTFGMELKMKSI